MKAIVTGGCGFIGSHLVELLIKNGHRVKVIDNLSSGNLNNLFGVRDKCDFYQADVSTLKPQDENFKDVDWVFHLAALADIVPSIVEPLKYHQANVEGTLRVIEACRQAGVKKLIYTASSSCYGIPEVYPTPETARISPEYPYALTKYVGEYYCLFWAGLYKLPVVSLRLFNVYGPRSRTGGTYGAVIGTFLAQKLAGKPFTVVGDGSQKRDFIYVTDVAEAFLLAAESNVTNDCFNVGSGSAHTVNELVRLLKGESCHIPKRPGEPDCTWANIEKIKNAFGWEPKVSFPEGIGRVLENIDYWKDAPVWTAEKIALATKEWFQYLSH